MENLRKAILKEFELDLVLKPFGDNNARNNVLLGENKEKSFIIKLQDVKHLEQVKLSIKIASNAIHLIPEIKEKQNLILQIIS